MECDECAKPLGSWEVFRRKLHDGSSPSDRAQESLYKADTTVPPELISNPAILDRRSREEGE